MFTGGVVTGLRLGQLACSVGSGAFHSPKSRSWTARALNSLRKADRERAEASALCWRGAYYNKYICTHEWTVWLHDSSYVGNSYFRKAYHRGFTFKMPILVFLLDTSASMNQRTYLGTTYLDVAKGAVEIFMKVKMDSTQIFSARLHLCWAQGSLAEVGKH